MNWKTKTKIVNLMKRQRNIKIRICLLGSVFVCTQFDGHLIVHEIFQSECQFTVNCIGQTSNFKMSPSVLRKCYFFLYKLTVYRLHNELIKQKIMDWLINYEM